MLVIPELVQAKAHLEGADGWLRDLPALVAGIEHDWSITVGATLTGGTESLVLDAVDRDGRRAVLKLVVPGAEDTAGREITALRVADGRGCVRLLRADAARRALLLERLGPQLHELGLPLEARHEILCTTLLDLWRPAPGCDLPTGADKGRWLVDFITRLWDQLDRPCSERVVDHAVACASRRIAAHDDERAVLVHGDAHQWNALQAADGFAFVDPDGLLAEPEYDLGILMREDPAELLDGDPHDRAHRLAARCGLDATAVWEWGVVERVSTGLCCRQVGLEPAGTQMLAVAERVAGRRD